MLACMKLSGIWYGLIMPQGVDWGFRHTRTSVQPCFAAHPCQPPTWLMLFQIAKTNVGGDGDVVRMNSKLAVMVFDHYAARC